MDVPATTRNAIVRTRAPYCTRNTGWGLLQRQVLLQQSGYNLTVSFTHLLALPLDISPAQTPGAHWSMGRVGDSSRTPLATNTCDMRDMTFMGNFPAQKAKISSSYDFNLLK